MVGLPARPSPEPSASSFDDYPEAPAQQWARQPQSRRAIPRSPEEPGERLLRLRLLHPSDGVLAGLELMIRAWFSFPLAWVCSNGCPRAGRGMSRVPGTLTLRPFA